ncbi:DUF2934 domain-containing protein [Tundrisphaera sp. TA3]|uniref:DUF2934 domain-containing protein n=1 Tax=Tundrisphaera sp. TA3 TaxID=3435775 RepID=UPI003EBD5008
MFPSPDQIQVAAYHRWMNRGGHHGYHDSDWAAAEQELLFALNYRVIARHRLDGIAPQYLGDEDEPRCRFCERTAPRATFAGPRPALPKFLGNDSLFTSEVCDDCHAQFRTGLDGDLERFTRPAREGQGVSGPTQAFVPVAAFKGLALAALAVMPEDELGVFEDAVEWVSNPDHGLDSRSIRGLSCIVHALPAAMPFSWVALARRVDEDDPMPYMIAFFGTGPAVFQIALPLCTRDEDIEGDWIVPRLPSPFGPGRGPDGVATTVVPLSSPEPRAETAAPRAGH